MKPGALQDNGILYYDGGFYVLRQSMPYPLAENNVLLIEDNHGWTVIDAGVDQPATRDTWSAALHELGLTFRQISRIIVSHCHPDHLGASAWLQRQTDAPVYMLDTELDRARRYVFLPAPVKNSYRNAISAELIKQGFPSELHEVLVDDWCDNVLPFFPEPSDIQILSKGQIISLGGNDFEVLALPAHSEGQIGLYCAQNRLVFVADALCASGYLHFSDWPHVLQGNPLQATMNTLDLLENLHIDRAIAGHGPSFQNLPEICAKLRRRYGRQLELVRILCAAASGPVRPGDIYTALDPLTRQVEYVHLHRVAVGETTGYMQYSGLSQEF